ncbi:MAG: LamG domain-containing protein [Cellulophaga sp.]|uniref:LamG domain-containing protein n=1 Tax=Cellulophaga sp. TaxID=1972202 RepID=UPI003263D4E5
MNKNIYVLSFIFLISCTSSRNNKIISEYPFNGNLNDYILAEIALPVGNITFEKTKYTKGLKFKDGKDENYIELPNLKLNKDDYTISFFVLFENFNKTNSVIFLGSKQESWGMAGLWIYNEKNKIAVSQEGQVLINKNYSFKKEYSDQYKLSKELTVRELNYVTITYSKSILKIYINGLLDSEYNGVKPIKDKDNRYFQLGIANDPKVGKKFQFIGVIDELKFFNKELSKEQVLELFTEYN